MYARGRLNIPNANTINTKQVNKCSGTDTLLLLFPINRSEVQNLKKCLILMYLVYHLGMLLTYLLSYGYLFRFNVLYSTFTSSINIITKQWIRTIHLKFDMLLVLWALRILFEKYFSSLFMIGILYEKVEWIFIQWKVNTIECCSMPLHKIFKSSELQLTVEHQVNEYHSLLQVLCTIFLHHHPAVWSKNYCTLCEMCT